MSNKRVRANVLLTLLTLVVGSPLRAADDAVRVIPGSELNLWWLADPSRANSGPGYFAGAIKAQLEGCMAVAYEIRSDGSVSNERVWSTDLSGRAAQQMERASLLALHQWRFVPASANTDRVPVYTYRILTFELSAGRYDADELASDCKVPDFPQQVQAITRAEAPAKGGTQ